MAQPPNLKPTTTEPKQVDPLVDEHPKQPEGHFIYSRYRRVSPQYAHARNRSWALLGGIVLATIVVFAVAAWLWQALGRAA